MSDAANPLYTVTIEGEGLALKRQIDAPTLGRVLYALLNGGEAFPSLGREAEADPVPVNSVTRMSLREYLTERGPHSYAEKITCIASYIEAHENISSFSKDQIKARFRTAGEPAPANFHRDFSNAVTAGWVAEDVENPGQFYVTHTGHTAIAAGFSAVGRTAPTRATRRRRGGMGRY